MAANLASLVNQQLYHAQLLLNMITEQDSHALHYRAAKQALVNAAIQAALTAYQGFLAETADSCQLKQNFKSIEELDAALALEGRSHAIVSNIKALCQVDSEFASSDNWLQALLKAQANILQASPAVSPKSNQPQLLIQASNNSIDEHDVQGFLNELTSFIDLQRDFLQEW